VADTFFVTAYLGQPHGSAKSARDFARALLATRSDIGIVSPWGETFGKTAAGYDLAAPSWFRYSRRPAPRRAWLEPFSVLKTVRQELRRRLIAHAMAGASVIVNGWASYGYWKTLAATGVKRSAIIIRESPRHFKNADRPECFEAMLAGFSEFDHLIFVSDRLRKEWSRYDALAGKPTFYLPNCCEEEEVALVKQTDRNRMRQRLGVIADDLMIICPGTIEKRKGQDIVLDALPEILAAIPNARLVLLGDAGTEWGKILAEDVDMGKYGERVVHVPAQPSALEYLHAADALLFPSRAEAMPRTILEGMAFGMPIIATSVDGIPELIEDGVSGWLFDPADSARMMAGLRWVASQPEAASKLALAAERRYQEFFSRSRQIERVGALLSWLDVD